LIDKNGEETKQPIESVSNSSSCSRSSSSIESSEFDINNNPDEIDKPKEK
jgi:hypothetical protein